MGKNDTIIRQLKFIAETKKGNYPNAESFSRRLQRYRDNVRGHQDDDDLKGCSPRTIARDIKDLITKHHAPLEYNAENRGYELTDPCWEFSAPVFEKDFVKFAMLGTHLAKDILPAPLDQNVGDAIDQMLATNTGNFFNRAMLDSIFCASGVTAEIDPEIFNRIFVAWRYNNTIRIGYTGNGENVSACEIEPHTLVFYRGDWYVCGYLSRSRDLRLVAVSSILSTQNVDTFAKDRDLVEKIRKKGFFDDLFRRETDAGRIGNGKKNDPPVLS
ncbi:MAG: WYL domain-containing protein [Victivallaceae bacterium]|nr:WYL domain-containing protein [Victivallaceae bacterium]